METIKKLGIGIAILVVLLIVVVNLDNSIKGDVVKGEQQPEGPIKIGFIGPLTGEVGGYGVAYQNVDRYLVKRVNDAGGINGRKIEIVYEDGKCDPKEATTAAQKLINVESVKVIQGGLCSGETLGAATVAEANKVILISPGSGSPDITNAGDYIFRNFPSDASSGSKIAEATIKRGHLKVAIMAEQTDYAQAVVGVFKETYESLGGEVVIEESFASDANDYRTQITKVKASGADALYLVPQSHTKVGIMLKQMNELGFDRQLYSNEMVSVDDVLREYSEELEGVIFALPGFDEENLITKEALNELKENNVEFGVLPEVYIAFVYDNFEIIVEAITACNGDDPECIKNYFYNIKDRQGAAGKLTINEYGDAELEYVLKEIRGTEIIEIN